MFVGHLHKAASVFIIEMLLVENIDGEPIDIGIAGIVGIVVVVAAIGTSAPHGGSIGDFKLGFERDNAPECVGISG